MDHIFEHSVEVIAWLGPATPLSDLLFRGLQTGKDLGGDLGAKSLANADALAADGDDDRWVRICTYRGIVLPKGPRRYDRLLFALTDLLQRPYFSRLWIVQECVLAPHLVFQAGDEQLDSAILATILRDLKLLNHACLRNVHVNDDLIRSYDILGLRYIWSADRAQGMLWPVGMDHAAVLDIARLRLVHDERDKVYGLVGMLNHIDPQIESFVVPNYQKPVQAVYMEATVALLKRSGSPDPLRFLCAKHNSSKHDLPSWCDDWSGPGDCRTKSFRGPYRQTPIHHATDPRTFRYDYNFSSKTLSVSGTIIDEVEAVSLPNLDEGDGKLIWTNWIDFIGGTTPYPHVFRIMLGDHDPDSQDQSRASREYIDAVIARLSDLKAGELRNLSLTSDKGPRAASMIDDALHRKTLFRTKVGMFGMSCHHAAVGDKVCLIDGGGLPFLIREVPPDNVQVSLRVLLREHHKVYQLIGGECYIHGLADGEMGHANAEKKDKIWLV